MITSAMIDSREPERIQKMTFGGVPTAVVPLDTGDVLVATDDNALLCIERKTPSDLLNTIRENRLFPQVTRMLEMAIWRYLVIEGDWWRSANNRVLIKNQGETGWNWDSVQGALLSVQELGVFVTQCEDGGFEQAVIRLANRERGEKTVTPPRLPNVLSTGEAIIAGLPGIGVERLGAVLGH